MRIKIFALKTEKIVGFTKKTVENDPKFAEKRDFFELIVPPLALLQIKDIFYIATHNMDPDEAEKRWKFRGMDAGINIGVHVTFFREDGQLAWDPMPAFSFATTPRELIAEYSTPLNDLRVWFQPDAHKKWLQHLFLTKNK